MQQRTSAHKHLYTGLFILILVVAGITGLSYLEDAGCNIKVLESKVSPDGKYIAKAIVKDCGATTGFSPQVKIGFSSTSLFDRKAFWGYQTDSVAVSWKGNNELQIYSDCSPENIYAIKDRIYSVNIRFMGRIRR